MHLHMNYRNQGSIEEILDFDWALGINRFSLQLMGIWPADRDKNSESFQTILRVPLMILAIFCGLFLPQMYALSLVTKELTLVIDNVMTSFPALTSCIKLFFIWRSKTILEPVIDSVLQDYLRPKSKSEELTMRREATRGRYITIADYSIMASCSMGFIILPTLGFHVRIINNITDYGLSGKHPLIVQAYYPYEYYTSPAYEFTILLQLAGSLFAAIAVAVPDDYFCVLVFHASAQYEILGQQIENLAIDGLKKEVDARSLSGFVERHVHLNKITSTVEKSFEFVIAMQIFLMSIMVCCMGVQVLRLLSNTGEKPTPLQIATLSGTFLSLLLQMFVDCFVSENLASRSSEVFYKIYSCRWYVLPYKTTRCLGPMMLVAKTPREMRAGKILPMSLTTYCSIVKSTAGYISMLVAVSGR